jgi:hypothetical protein
MNPYLEQGPLWQDFHNTFLVTLRTALSPQVAPRYFVELEVSLYLDPSDEDDRLIGIADAALPGSGRPGKPGGAVAAIAAPVTVTVPGVTRRKARRLVVRDTKNREVVTVIEVLSPSNKAPGSDRTRYLDKRTEVLTTATSFVEIDLLRGGSRMPVRKLPSCDYYALVSRHWERPEMGLWPVRLRDPLPKIPIPLREGDPEPAVELQSVLHQTYDGAGYAYHIYQSQPEPPLSAEDAAWAKGVLAAAGLSTATP